MKKIKVCFISLGSYPLFNPQIIPSIKGTIHGGAELNCYLIAEELAKDPQYEIHFIVGDFGQPLKETRKNIILHRSFSLNPNMKYLKYSIGFLKLYNLCRKINADIYFQSSAGIITGLIALYCKIARKKFIFRTAHDRDCNGEFIANHLFLGIFYKFGLFNTSLIITQTKLHQKALLNSLNLKSVVLKNAIPLPKFLNEKEWNYILWVGRLVEVKQPYLFIELARKNPQENFLLIGSGNRIYERDLFQLSKKLTNFRYIPHVPFHEIQKYFIKAKVFVSTSLSEGFPNTFIQAFSCMTPIVSLHVNPNNIFKNNKMGFFANSSMKTFELLLRELIENINLRKEMGKSAFDYVKKNHDLKVVINDYKKILNHL